MVGSKFTIAWMLIGWWGLAGLLGHCQSRSSNDSIGGGSLSDNSSKPGLRGIFDRSSWFAGLEGSKQPQDFGVNANLGSRYAASFGGPLLEDRNLGWQLGTAIQFTDNAVRVNELLGAPNDRFQSYTTAGLFRNGDSGWSCGAVYDFLYQDSFDQITAGQVRTTLSKQIFETQTIGLRASIPTHGDGAHFLQTPVRLRPISQGSLFWRQYWPTTAQTTFVLGVSDSHSESNAVTGPSPRVHGCYVLGADVFMPLTHRIAIYGETNLTSPFDTGTVDAFLGVQWFPGGNACAFRRGTFAPLHGVAGSTSMPLDLSN